jgi:hypothetical protein
MDVMGSAEELAQLRPVLTPGCGEVDENQVEKFIAISLLIIFFVRINQGKNAKANDSSEKDHRSLH